MSQWLACLSESPTCIFPPNRPASSSPVLCTRAHLTLPTSSFPGQRGLGRDDYATHSGQPNHVGMELPVYIQFFNWASSLARIGYPLSSPSSVVGREEDFEVSSRRLVNILLLPPGLSHGRVPSLPLRLPRSLRFLIPLSGGKFPCASLRLPPFHDLHILLTLQPYHTAGRYIAGDARSEKRPTTAPALPAAPPHLVSHGCDLCITHPPARNPSTPLLALGFRLITELGSWRLVTFSVFSLLFWILDLSYPP